jgi:hypothetical protein
MINPRFIFVLALLSCDDSSASRETCNQTLDQSIAMTNSLKRLDAKLSQLQLQPECAACPAPRACPDDSAVLARGDEAIREMEQVREAVRRYKNDSDYRYADLISLLNNLAGE